MFQKKLSLCHSKCDRMCHFIYPRPLHISPSITPQHFHYQIRKNVLNNDGQTEDAQFQRVSDSGFSVYTYVCDAALLLFGENVQDREHQTHASLCAY